MNPEAVDKAMSGHNATLANYHREMRGMDERAATMPQPSGPTAGSVLQEQAAAPPATWSEFTSRGGLQNTAHDIFSKVRQKLDRDEKMKMYEQLLKSGERGADALYTDAVNIYGEDIKEWVPPKTFFYDETGVFLPHQYAQSVALGVKKYEEAKGKAEAEQQAQEQQRTERQQVGNVLSAATTPQEAAAGTLQAGYDPGAYDKAIGTVPTEQESTRTAGGVIDNQYSPQRHEVQIAEIQARTKKLLAEAATAHLRAREGGGAGKPPVTIDQLKKNNAGLTGTIQRYNSRLLDMRKDSDERPMIEEDIKVIRNQIKQNDGLIRTLQEQHGLEETPEERPEGSRSAEVESTVAEMRRAVEAMTPRRYDVTDTYGKPTFVLSKDKNARPRDDLYNNAAALQVKRFAQVRGFDLPHNEIVKELSKRSLEDVVEHIMQQSGGR